jgi:hypothetical protein
LKLDPSTGLIRGTPTTTTGGPFSFSVTVSDSAGGKSPPAAFSLSINPPVTVAAVKLSHQSVLGGQPTGGNRVVLTGPAPQTGAVVSLSSGNPAVAAVPASVTMHAGQTFSPVFNIVTTPVATETPVTISATYGGATQMATLTVNPLQITSLTLSPVRVVGGKSTTNNTVNLNGAAPAGGAVVTLTSGKPAVASVPDTVTVPASASSTTFTITTTAVTSDIVVHITAAYGGVSERANLTVCVSSTKPNSASWSSRHTWSSV